MLRTSLFAGFPAPSIPAHPHHTPGPALTTTTSHRNKYTFAAAPKQGPSLTTLLKSNFISTKNSIGSWLHPAGHDNLSHPASASSHTNSVSSTTSEHSSTNSVLSQCTKLVQNSLPFGVTQATRTLIGQNGFTPSHRLLKSPQLGNLSAFLTAPPRSLDLPSTPDSDQLPGTAPTYFVVLKTKGTKAAFVGVDNWSTVSPLEGRRPSPSIASTDGDSFSDVGSSPALSESSLDSDLDLVLKHSFLSDGWTLVLPGLGCKDPKPAKVLSGHCIPKALKEMGSSTVNARSKIVHGVSLPEVKGYKSCNTYDVLDFVTDVDAEYSNYVYTEYVYKPKQAVVPKVRKTKRTLRKHNTKSTTPIVSPPQKETPRLLSEILRDAMTSTKPPVTATKTEPTQAKVTSVAPVQVTLPVVPTVVANTLQTDKKNACDVDSDGWQIVMPGKGRKYPRAPKPLTGHSISTALNDLGQKSSSKAKALVAVKYVQTSNNFKQYNPLNVLNSLPAAEETQAPSERLVVDERPKLLSEILRAYTPKKIPEITQVIKPTLPLPKFVASCESIMTQSTVIKTSQPLVDEDGWQKVRPEKSSKNPMSPMPLIGHCIPKALRDMGSKPASKQRNLLIHSFDKRLDGNKRHNLFDLLEIEENLCETDRVFTPVFKRCKIVDIMNAEDKAIPPPDVKNYKRCNIHDILNPDNEMPAKEGTLIAIETVRVPESPEDNSETDPSDFEASSSGNDASSDSMDCDSLIDNVRSSSDEESSTPKIDTPDTDFGSDGAKEVSSPLILSENTDEPQLQQGSNDASLRETRMLKPSFNEPELTPPNLVREFKLREFKCKPPRD